MLRKGKLTERYFNKKGELLHIKRLHMWPLQDVLIEKYHFDKEEAFQIADFLLPMLEIDPMKRIKARDALKSAWLDDSCHKVRNENSFDNVHNDTIARNFKQEDAANNMDSVVTMETEPREHSSMTRTALENLKIENKY